MMPNQERAAKLGREAFDVWQSGRLEDAVPMYKAAIDIADPGHWRTPGLHVECAAVLSNLGRAQEASAHYEQAIAGLIALGPAEDDPELAVTTYFFADHLLRFDDPKGALSTIAKARTFNRWKDYLLCSVEAQALWAMGRHQEAKEVAQRALQETPTPEAAERVRETLADILGPTQP